MRNINIQNPVKYQDGISRSKYQDVLRKYAQTLYIMHNTEAYSEPCHTYKIQCFEKIVKGQKSLTIFPKRSILHF